MRNVTSYAMLVGLAASLSCGGAAAPAAGASSPVPSVAAVPSASRSVDEGSGPATGHALATTTLDIPDGGDLQGTKLTETHVVASSSAGAAPAPTPPHVHEPGRAPRDIRTIILSHRDEARACYDSALPDHPGIEGDLVVEWTIDPKGNVTQVALDTAKSQIAEPTVVSCISEIIKRIQFAASPGGYETRTFYPFNFHPHHRSGAVRSR